MGLMPYRRAGSPGQNERASSTGNQGETGVGYTPHTRRFTFRKLLAFGVPVLLLLAVGCTDDLQSTWDPAGPVAEKQLQLFNVLLWVMVAVFVLVEGALLYVIIRFRSRPGRVPSRSHGNLPLEIAWTIVPTILVLGLGIWSVFTLFEIDEPPSSEQNVLEVIATGHQWWFEFEYPDAKCQHCEKGD